MNGVPIQCPEFQDRVYHPPCPFHFVEADEVGGIPANYVRKQGFVGVMFSSGVSRNNCCGGSRKRRAIIDICFASRFPVRR